MSILKLKFENLNKVVEVELYDNDVAKDLFINSPTEVSLSKWGDEFYGTLDFNLNPRKEKRRDVFEKGEVALWPTGNAFCIFFGPTPVSIENEPRMASPGVPLGKIKENDLTFLKEMDSYIDLKIEK